MGQVLLLLVVGLTVAAVVFGVTVLVTGRDPGLAPAEPDGRAVPLPGTRPLRESDVGDVRFDTALRGYRMAQVDQAMRRAAYDIGYKAELIGVLEAEVNALREGRTADADALRQAREQSAGGADEPTPDARAERDDVPVDGPAVDTTPAPGGSARPSADPTSAPAAAPFAEPADRPAGPATPNGAAVPTGEPGPARDAADPSAAAPTDEPGPHGRAVRSEAV
jgi:DivIVA domain-containing protein